jgi:uncharacterized membrane protein
MTAKKSKVPLYATICIVAMVIAAVVLILFSDAAQQAPLATILGLFVTCVPALIAAFYSEKMSKDMSNGAVSDKVEQAVTKALEKKGGADNGRQDV